MFKCKINIQILFTSLGLVFLSCHALAADGSYDSMTTTAMRGTYLFSTGNIDNPDMIFTKDFVRHEQQYLTPEAKTENISKLIESQRSIYKVEDIQTEPLNVIVDTKTNTVALRWSAAVKRLPDASADIPENMNFEGVTISRFEQGKIAEQWVYYDSNLVLTLTRLSYKNYFESKQD